MEMLRLYSQADLEGCPSDKWGILDPGLERFDIKGKSRENGMPFRTVWFCQLTVSHG